jgi:predicted nucleotidyltransferase
MKLSDVAKTIKGSLENVPGIRSAFIYGASVKGQRPPASELHVMVVGGPDLNELEEAVLRTEKELGRKIAITCFSLREFRERVKSRDGLVMRALQKPRIMLIGNEDDLKEL